MRPSIDRLFRWFRKGRKSAQQTPLDAQRAFRPTKIASEKPSRLFHLGVDFGTCWSKLVLRDMQARTPRSFVVRPGQAFEAENEYRIPSSVTLAEDKLWFGWAGVKKAGTPGSLVFESIKMKVAFPNQSVGGPLRGKLLPRDLATLVVAYLLQVGDWAASDYCSRLKPQSQPRMGMTIGVPMRYLSSKNNVRDAFLEIARVAFDIYKIDNPDFAAGIGVEEAFALVQRARERVASKPGIGDPRDWVRSEAEAGCLWIFRSPEVGEGLFGCVDIGAGTTDVSFFRLTAKYDGLRWVKHGLAFYSSESMPPAVDEVDRVILRHREHFGHNLSAVRGHEATLLTTLDSHAQIEACGVGYRSFETYQKAWQDAYRKEKRQSRWTDYTLFVLGGGSKLAVFRDAMNKSVWEGQLKGRAIARIGFPEDLFEWDTTSPPQTNPFEGDATFLLVAYGLSHLGVNVPPVENPDNVQPLDLSEKTRPPVDQDEYYPK